MILDVLTWPDPRLLEIAEDVDEVTDEVRAFAADLVETMYASGGVGLAATQVGVPWRIVAVDCSPRDPDAMPHLLINARIVMREGTILWQEGCLSLPGITAEVERAAKIEVTYLDGDGAPQTLTVEDLEAVCVQHELDHLDGILYVDRLGTLEKKAALNTYDDIRQGRVVQEVGRVVEEVELVEVEAE